MQLEGPLCELAALAGDDELHQQSEGTGADPMEQEEESYWQEVGCFCLRQELFSRGA